MKQQQELVTLSEYDVANAQHKSCPKLLPIGTIMSRIAQIFRYPVKGLSPETMTAALASASRDGQSVDAVLPVQLKTPSKNQLIICEIQNLVDGHITIYPL